MATCWTGNSLRAFLFSLSYFLSSISYLLLAFPFGGGCLTMGNIVWLASYQKSGNTWVRAFLHHLFADDADPAAPERDRLERTTGGRALELELDLVDVGQDRRDVLLVPVVAAAIEENPDLHAAARLRLRNACPLIRRQAMSATVWIRSS